MPERPSLNYSLRVRPHNKTLIAKTTQLNDQDFIIRSIYKDLYWLRCRYIQHASMLALFSYVCLYRTFYVFYYCTHCCVCQLDTKENDDDDDDETQCTRILEAYWLVVTSMRIGLYKYKYTNTTIAVFSLKVYYLSAILRSHITSRMSVVPTETGTGWIYLSTTSRLSSDRL